MYSLPLPSVRLTFGATALGDQSRALEVGGLPANASGIDTLDVEFARVAAELGALADA